MTLFRNLRDLLTLKLRPSANSQEICLCMFVTEQEGAEIWLDGKPTGFFTPKLMEIPKNRIVSVEFRLPGHEPHRAQIHSGTPLTYYYCQLTRIPLRLISGETHFEESHLDSLN